MPIRHATLCGVVLVISLLLPPAVSAEDYHANSIHSYHCNLINHAIAHCDAKDYLRSSYNESERRAAAFACLKSAYYREYKIIYENLEYR